MGMTPKTDNAIRRPDLGILFQELVDDSIANGFIANEVMPFFPTDEENATYDMIPMEAFLNTEDDLVADDGAYGRNNWQYETGRYSTNDRGLEEGLPDKQRKKFDKRTMGSSERIVMKRLVYRIMRSREKRVADMVFNASNFTANALTNEWDDATNATPVTDVQTAQLAVYLASGIVPMDLIVNYAVFRNLQKTDQIVDALTGVYGVSGTQDILNVYQLSAMEIAKVLGVNRILVGGALYNSAAGGQDATIAKIWSDEYAMLTTLHPGGADIVEPALGVTFNWIEDSAINGGMPIMEQYREEQTRRDVFRARWYIGEEFIKTVDNTGTAKSSVYKNVSYLFSNVTT